MTWPDGDFSFPITLLPSLPPVDNSLRYIAWDIQIDGIGTRGIILVEICDFFVPLSESTIKCIADMSEYCILFADGDGGRGVGCDSGVGRLTGWSRRTYWFWEETKRDGRGIFAGCPSPVRRREWSPLCRCVDGHRGYGSSWNDIVGIESVVSGCVKRRVNVHSILA